MDTPVPHGHAHAHDDGHHGHDHDHDHDHDHGPGWKRLLHPVAELFGVGHSHDAADSVDEALEANVAGRRALWISLGGLLITAAIQAGVVALSGSVALLGDTLHNLADALTAVPLLIASGWPAAPLTPGSPTATGGPRTSPGCSSSR
jgi:Co/Zn/Cd efflux system component